MNNSISLLDFWRIQRKYRGDQTIIRPCHIKKAEVLTKLMLGELDRPNLMILEPPRMGKTDLSVKAFIAWSMSFFDDSEFIISGYSHDLSCASSVYIRNTLSAEWYRKLRRKNFGATVKMSGEKAGGRQDYFFTTNGGSVKAVGVGGGITGFGAGKLRSAFGGAIIVDDPIKAQDANSPTVREKTINWVHGTLESRRNRKKDPMTPIILDMQRLHTEDLAGHFLATQRDRWEVVQIPAIDEHGINIWPERISEEELKYTKENNPDIFWAQWMQEPRVEENRVFQPDIWKFWNFLAEVEKRITLKVITSDTAFKAKESSDFSVFQCWGYEGTKATYLLDQIRGKWEFPELIVNGREFIKKHTAKKFGITPATEAWVEDKASGISLVQTLRREGIFVNGWEPPDSISPDKVARANQCMIPMRAGRIFIPNPKIPGYKWVENFINEHSAFTKDNSHLYDDQVDAETMANLIWISRGGGQGELPRWEENQIQQAA